MSMFRRMSLVFQQKANAAMDKVEDPNQALDLSYQKILEQYQQVRRAVADVLTSQKRLEGQRANLAAQYEKLQGQARQALGQNQEDVARTALARAEIVQQQMTGLDPQIQQLRVQQGQLELTAQKLGAQVEAFRTQRETMKAQYTAAKASTQAVEGITGISEQMTDVSLMLDRAQDKIENMKARSAAVGELADSGILDSLQLGVGGDDIDAQLRKGGANTVDAQLAAMKAELASGTEPKASIGAGSKDLVVRVTGHAQYAVASSIRPALDGLDEALTAAMEANDTEGFAAAAAELQKLIQANGKELPPDDVRPSDLIVPAADMTLEEARSLMDQQEES